MTEEPSAARPPDKLVQYSSLVWILRSFVKPHICAPIQDDLKVTETLHYAATHLLPWRRLAIEQSKEAVLRLDPSGEEWKAIASKNTARVCTDDLIVLSVH